MRKNLLKKIIILLVSILLILICVSCSNSNSEENTGAEQEVQQTPAESNNTTDVGDDSSDDPENPVVESEEEDVIAVSKLVDSNDWVYGADYHLDTVVDSYKAYTDHTRPIRASELVVPYINVDSEDAKRANEELYGLYEKLIEAFNEEAKKDQVWYEVVKYESALNGNILSVMVRVESGGTDAPRYTYYTYNFSLKDGSILSYKDAYNLAGFDKSSLEEKVNEIVEEELKDEYDADTYISQTLKAYQEQLDNDALPFFFDSKGRLYAAINFQVPYGTGEEYRLVYLQPYK